MPCYRGDLSSWHPKFAAGSEAVCKDDAVPVPMDAPDIKWTVEDDKVIEDYVRAYGMCYKRLIFAFIDGLFVRLVTTTWHSVSRTLACVESRSWLMVICVSWGPVQ